MPGQLGVCVRAYVLSRVRLFVTPRTVAYQAPQSMEFFRQTHWSGLRFPSPGDLPNPGIEPASLMSPALVGWFSTTSATWEAPLLLTMEVQTAAGRHSARVTLLWPRPLPFWLHILS